MKLKSGLAGPAWARQTTFPSESYKSARAAHGIWQTSVKDMGKNGKPKKRATVFEGQRQELLLQYVPGWSRLYNRA